MSWPGAFEKMAAKARNSSGGRTKVSRNAALSRQSPSQQIQSVVAIMARRSLLGEDRTKHRDARVRCIPHLADHDGLPSCNCVQREGSGNHGHRTSLNSTVRPMSRQPVARPWRACSVACRGGEPFGRDRDLDMLLAERRRHVRRRACFGVPPSRAACRRAGAIDRYRRSRPRARNRASARTMVLPARISDFRGRSRRWPTRWLRRRGRWSARQGSTRGASPISAAAIAARRW